MNIGWNIPRSQIANNFLDRPKVMAMMNARTLRYLNYAGGYTRRVAMNSIRTPRKRVRDLTTEERKAHRRRVAIAKFYGRKPPKLPIDTAPSRPGQPPRNQTGLLRSNIFYSLESQRRSVVAGPARLGGGSEAPRALEEGGSTRIGGRRTRIAARPYMRPALDKALEPSRQQQFWSRATRAA